MTGWRFFGILFLILCINYVFYSGIVKSIHLDMDGYHYYIAGKTWLAGKSPYDFNTFDFFWKKDLNDSDYENTRDFYKVFLKEGYAAFIYPPTMGILAIPLALFSWKTAQIILDVLNLSAVLSILFFSIGLAKRFLPVSIDPGKIWFGIGMSGFMSAVPITFTFGQASLLTTMGFLGTIYFYLRSNILIATLFLVIASFKPQLSFLPLIYLFILAGNWRFIACNILLVGAITMSILMIGGDNNLLTLAQNLLITHISLKSNADGGFPGIYWFILQLNTQYMSALVLSIISILFAASLAVFFKHRYRDCFAQHADESTKIKTFLLLNFYLSLATFFMPQHLSDHVILMLVFTLLWVIRWRFTIFLLPGLLLIARPTNIAHFLQPLFKTVEITPQMISSFGTLWIAIFFAVVFFCFSHKVIQKTEINDNKVLLVSNASIPLN